MISSSSSLLRKRRDQRLLHRFVDEFDIEERGRIGDRRMSPVQDTDLHELEWRDIRNELHTNALQRRPACRKIVF